MKAKVQFVQTPFNKTAEDLVIKKLEKLGNKFDWVIYADVFFKKEKDPTGKGNICDIRLSVPGPRIHASSNEESLEEAVAETIRDLERLLIKRKDEMKAH